MKFKFTKDNSETAYTKEMKQKEKELIEVRRELRKKNSEIAVLKDRKNRFDHDRKAAYPNLGEQLDMLWHDIDSGVIPIDKQNSNSWYQKIKAAKKQVPNPKDRKTEQSTGMQAGDRPNYGTPQYIRMHRKENKTQSRDTANT
jgi:hypothetical protein